VQNWLGSTALIDAARNGHAEIVKMLLDAKADVGRQSLWGDTALNMAESRGHTEIVEILKAKGDVTRGRAGGY
jgi:uncharacterized protein